MRYNDKMANLRRKTKRVLSDKYFNLFRNNYEFLELSKRQNNYIFRKLWNDGKIACFESKGLAKLAEKGEVKRYDALRFAPFVVSAYNHYDAPSQVNLVNERGVGFIPSGALTPGKDVVLGYIQPSLKGVKTTCDYYIERITDYTRLIALQENTHKSPFLLAVPKEGKERRRTFRETLRTSDDPALFCDVEEVNAFKALNVGTPYIIDKLYQQKRNWENELLTFLGIENLGGSEKKEHLITAEVENNTRLIKEHSDIRIDGLGAFAEEVEEVLGYHLTLACKSENYLNYDKMTDEETTYKGDENEQNDDSE